MAQLFNDYGCPAPASDDAGVLQIKTANQFKAADWEGDWPLRYQVQCQEELVVTERTWGVVAVLIGGQKLKLYPYELDTEFAGVMSLRLDEFWEGVQNRTPPEPDDHVATRETLKRMFPNDDGQAIELPEEALSWDARLREAKATIRDAKKIADKMENQLRACIGEATYGVLPSGNGVRYSWKQQHRAAYEVATTSYRVLRRHKG